MTDNHDKRSKRNEFASLELPFIESNLLHAWLVFQAASGSWTLKHKKTTNSSNEFMQALIGDKV